MLRFIVKRFFEAIPVLLIVVTLTFFMMKFAKGGPLDKEKQTTPEIRKQQEAYYGLDKPLWQQYLIQMNQLFHGNLPPSYRYAGWTSNELIGAGLPVSLELGCYGLSFALAIGFTAGIVASLGRNTARDYVPMSLATLGICLPTFVTGPLLILAFGILLHFFNTSGWDFPSDRVLPAITLGLYYTAYVSRLTRGGMLEILNQDFIRTARAKGASNWRILWKHSLRAALLPVISFLGPAIAGVITGSFVVEKIFDIPGIGRYFVTAATNRDYTLLMSTTILYAVLIVACNLVADILQVWLNPKLRF